MTTAQRILKNFLSLTFADIFTKFLGIITVSYLARVLGPGDFGKINFALAIVGYFAILSHFGLNTIGTREIARNRENAGDWAGKILLLKLCLGIIAYALLVIFVLLISKPVDIKYLIVFYGLTIFTMNVLPFDWVFQGIEKMEYISIALILQTLVYLGLILLLVRSSEQLLFVPWLLVFAQLIGVFFLFLMFMKECRKVNLNITLSSWKNLLKQTVPIGLTGIMTIIILNTGTVMLGFMRSVQEVGYFAAAYKIMWILVGTSGTFVTAIFPVISNYYKTSMDSFNRLLHYTFKLIMTIGLPTIAGIMVLAKPIISLIYGIEFSDAVVILQILIWNVLLTFMHVIFSHTLWAADRQKIVLKVVIIHAICVILFNLILISEFGLVGAGIATVVAGFVALIVYQYEIKKIADIRIRRYMLKPAGASFIMSLFLYSFLNCGLFVLISLGVVIYCVSIYLFKGIEKEDIELALETIRLK